jgi:hypothetical protein
LAFASCGFVDRAFAFSHAYAFVTVEASAPKTGTLETIDLAALKTGATVAVGQKAAGVNFYKTEPAK